jgi:hypothetical protein
MTAASPRILTVPWSRSRSRSGCRSRSRRPRYAIRRDCPYVACLCGLEASCLGDISISDGES